MNLIGKKFEDSSGKILEVSNIDGNVAHIKDSDARISVERLLDHNHYSEIVDPNSFFNSERNFYTNLTESVKNIPLDGTGQGTVGTTVVSIGDSSGVIDPVESHNNAQNVLNNVSITPPTDDRVIELQRKAEEMANSSNIQSNRGFEDIIDEEELIPLNKNLEGAVYEDRKTTVTTYNENNELQPQSMNVKYPNDDFRKESAPVINPVYQMFDGIKRSQKIDITLKLKEIVPKKDFIKMFEENYNDSIIDYLADEFYNKLMKDPSIIRDQISKAIREKVYVKRKKVTRKKTDKSTTQSKNPVNKTKDKK